MLKGVRKNAGLGDPPEAFYINVPESVNALIERNLNFKETELSDFCFKFKRVIQQQREDVRSALINRGPYKLHPLLSNLTLTHEKWFSISVKQRELIKILKRKCGFHFQNAR